MSTLDELLVGLNRPQIKDYHLFISHSWDYGDHRTNLGQLIVKGLAPHNVYDYSAPKDHPIHSSSDNDLINALVERIQKSNILIFPAGVYVSHSTWVPIEIAIAQRLRKPILAVQTWGAQRSTTATAAANEILGWNSNTIAGAIKRWHP